MIFVDAAKDWFERNESNFPKAGTFKVAGARGTRIEQFPSLEAVGQVRHTSLWRVFKPAEGEIGRSHLRDQRVAGGREF